MKWHDGQPMTADDVVFSVMKFHYTLSPRARVVFASITSATAVDPHTVQFTLSTPFEPFLLMFDVTTTAIMPKHIYDGTDYRNNPANQKPIGTGAFQFDEWQRGNFIRLKRFEQYWKPGQPYLDEIIYRIIPDSQSRALALQTGQVQMSAANDIEPFDVPRFQQQANLTVETKGWEYFSPVMWIELNHRVKPLNDVRVRQAMSMALDRDFILKRLWFGVGKVATSPVASTTRFYDPASKLPPHDVKAANALLDEAGLKPDSSGVRFKLRHLVLPYGEVWSRLAEYLRASFKQIGIELTLESTDTGGWAQADRELGLRYVDQLRVPVRRPDAGRGADLRIHEHPEDRVHQHRRLREPGGGQAVHHRPQRRHRRRAAGRVLCGAEDPDPGDSADLAAGNVVPDHPRQEGAQPDHARHRDPCAL